MNLHLLKGDCVERMRAIPDGVVRAVVSDPPYGISFMGKEWDTLTGSATRPDSSESAADRANRGKNHGIHAGKPAFDLTIQTQQAMQVWHADWLREAYRVLQPGGPIKAFCASRTYHRLAAAMEDVGFQVTGYEAWAYGNGFPKGLNLSKAVDDALGVEREVTGQRSWIQGGGTALQLRMGEKRTVTVDVTRPGSPQGLAFEGYNTALKPCWEPFVVGVKKR